MNVEPTNKKPAYLQQRTNLKEKREGLNQATKAFQENVQLSNYTYKDYNYTRPTAEERVPETTAIINKVKQNPEEYEIDYYDNGNYKEIRTKDEEYLTKRIKNSDGEIRKGYSTYNKTIYEFNSDGSIKRQIINGIYKEKEKNGKRYSIRADEIIEYDYQTGQVKKSDYRDKNKAKAKRQSYKEPEVQEQYMTVKNGKVVIVDKQGTIIRTTIKPQEVKTSLKLLKDYNQLTREQRADQRKAGSIITKINTGTATNKDYVDYININAKYGTNLKKVKQAVQIGETNKKALNVKSQNVFSPEQRFVDKNPDLKVSEQYKVKRFYNDKGQIIGISGLGQSTQAPEGSFYKEEDIKNAELKATASLKLSQKANELKQEEVLEKTPSEKLLNNTGKFFETNLAKIGINLTEEKEDWGKGFNILSSTIEKDYQSVKRFAKKNFIGLNSTQGEGGQSIGPVLEGAIANKVLLGVEPKENNISNVNLLLGNYEPSELAEVKPLYQVLQNKRKITLKLGTTQANRMVESFTADYKPVKVFGATILNQRQVQSTTIGANVVAELGLGVVDMGLMLGSKLTEKPITTTAIVATGVGAYTIAPKLTATAFVGLNAYDWASRPTAEEKILAVGGDLGLSAIAVGAPKLIEAQITKLNPDYTKVEVDSLGRKVIKGVDVGEDSRKIDIELVPEGTTGLKNMKVNPKKLLQEYGDSIPLKNSPMIPKTTKFQEEFLNILKEDEIKFATDTSVGGSFAQKALLKKSRPFGDLDIVTDDPLLIAMKTKEKFGDVVSIKKTTITDSPLGEFNIYKVAERQTDGSLKHIADIDPLRFAEEGLASKYGSTEINGLPITDIRSRFVAKVQQAVRGKRTAKVLEDIKILSDGKLTLDSQSIRGAFGWSFKEQAVFVDTTGDVITAQRGLFKNKIFNKYKEDIIVNKPNVEPDSLESSFFASPPDAVSGNPQLRASRLGLYADSKADFTDLLSGNVQIGKGKPQAVIFPNAKIADIPENLKGIFAKAKAGDKVAEAEFFRLYKEEQMTPTGEFKPFGYAGGEAELTLPPQEIITGEGQLGVTLINNQKVSIIKAKIKQASPELAELQTKAVIDSKTKAVSGLTNEETTRLKTLLEEESGILQTREIRPIIAEENIISSASGIREIKTPTQTIMNNDSLIKETYYPKQKLISSTNVSSKAIKFEDSIPINRSDSKSSQLIKTSSPINKSDSKSYADSKIDYSSSVSSTLGISNPSINISSSSVYSPSPSSSISYSQPVPPSPIINSPSTSGLILSPRSSSRRQKGYDVFVKTKGVWIKKNIQPIRNVEEAENFGKYVVSTTPQASFQTKQAQTISPTISFNKVVRPNSFYKKGKTFIEKNKFRINTQGELKGITFKGLQAQTFKKNKSWRI